MSLLGAHYPLVNDPNAANAATNVLMRQPSQGVAPATPGPPSQIHPSYMNNIRQWSNSVTPPPTNGRTNPTRRTRPTRGSSLVPQPPPPPPIASSSSSGYPHPSSSQPIALASIQTISVQPAQGLQTLPPTQPTQGPRPVLPTKTQALHTTYASRLRTGTTLLLQPIIGATSASNTTTTRATRRGGVVNYADPGSGDEFPDAGAIDSDDSDFIASGGTRSAIRSARLSRNAPVGSGVFHSGTMSPALVHTPQPVHQHQQQHQHQSVRNELDQSYLGMIPPARFIVAKLAQPTKHEYFTQHHLEAQARKPSALVPIRVEFETETQRVRDCFVWNLNEELIQPESFARTFCADLDLQPVWVETVANQIRAQLEEHEGVAALDLNLDTLLEVGTSSEPGEEIPECRVILSIDVQIATYHLQDHIEWDLLSPLTPETFASKLCAELGLSGEAIPLIAHAIHEELVKHKRDVLEWGVLGLESSSSAVDPDKPRDKSGLSLLKDKTGLGLGWGRTPKDGRGPKVLKSVWRDWPEAEEFRTRFEVLSAEEVERREVEKERASRRLRRETSKFQSQSMSTRRKR